MTTPFTNPPAGLPSWPNVLKGGALVAAGGAGAALAADLDPTALLTIIERIGLPGALLLLGLRWVATSLEKGAAWAAPKVERAAASFDKLADSQERLTTAMAGYGVRLDEAAEQGQADHAAILEAVMDGGAKLQAIAEAAEGARAAASRAAVAAEALHRVIGAAALERIVPAAPAPREGKTP